jgi:type IV pilus assembly protein PilM
MATTHPPTCVGLDIGTSGIRAVEVRWRRRRNTYEITRAASVELPPGVVRNGSIADPKLVTKALTKLWRRGHFSTRKVVLGLADSTMLTRQVDLPWMPTEDFAAALRYQVADALPVDMSTVEVGYHLLSEHHRTDANGQAQDVNRILVVAANTEAVTAESKVLRKARLVPIAADSSAFALIRAACHGSLPTSAEVQAIIDMGADQLTVVIHQSGQPRFIRTISNLGGDTATAGIAEKLGISTEEAEQLKRATGLNGPAPVVAPIAESSVFGSTNSPETAPMDARSAAAVAVLNPWATTLIGEVRNSLDYFQATDSDTSVTSLVVTGRTAELDGVVERLATQLPMPVTVMDPLVGLVATRRVAKNPAPDTRLTVATGLAMGAMS